MWHSYSGYQLFYVIEGTGIRFIRDSIKSFGPANWFLPGHIFRILWRREEPYFERNNTLTTRRLAIYLNEHFLGEDILDKEEFVLIKKLFTKSMRGREFHGDKRRG